MILVFSNEQDVHARRVTAELDALSAPYTLYDTASFPTASRLILDYDPDAERILSAGDRLIDLTQVATAWWRRPQPFCLHSELTTTDVRNFAYGEIGEAFEGMYQLLDAFWVNDPLLDQRAGRKAYQLTVAQKLGLRTPRTLITNDPARARAFAETLGCKRTVYKPFKGAEVAWRETRILKRRELSLLEKVKYAPVIFQEYIEAVADLRITAVGGQLFAAAIDLRKSSYPQDFRMDLGNCTIAATELPSEIEHQLLALMRELGLSYGAIDMRLTPDGEYLFLEINPAGQWLFIEQVTGQPITRAMAELLAAGQDNWLAKGRGRGCKHALIGR